MKNQRTKNVLLGLALGDALSWQSLFHRGYDLPFWTRRLRREIDVESEDKGIIRLNLPFSLNTPVSAFKMSPTDDTEWAAFTASLLIEKEGYDYETNINAWKQLASSDDKIRGSVAVIGTLANLKKGLNPPESGNDNPHYFDDSAMTRAVVIGAFYAGKKDEACKFASVDAAITNALDGVWAAQSIASAVSTACVENDINKITSSALEHIPANSWLSLKVKVALKIVEKHKTIISALPVLYDEIIDHSYNYGTSAPDNLALTLAIFQLCKGDITLGVTTAASLAKTADSVPAFVGALCGALQNEPFEEQWVKRFSNMKGICIPSLKGKNFYNLADKLNIIANEKNSNL